MDIKVEAMGLIHKDVVKLHYNYRLNTVSYEAKTQPIAEYCILSWGRPKGTPLMTKAKVTFFFVLMLNNLVVSHTDSMSLETQEQNRELKGVFVMENNIFQFFHVCLDKILE